VGGNEETLRSAALLGLVLEGRIEGVPVEQVFNAVAGDDPLFAPEELHLLFESLVDEGYLEMTRDGETELCTITSKGRVSLLQAEAQLIDADRGGSYRTLAAAAVGGLEPDERAAVRREIGKAAAEGGLHEEPGAGTDETTEGAESEQSAREEALRLSQLYEELRKNTPG
jgi:hypothetical protein